MPNLLAHARADEVLRKGEKRATDLLGMPLQEWLGCLDGRAVFATIPVKAESEGAGGRILLAGVSQTGKLAIWLQSLAPRAGKLETVQDLPVLALRDGRYLGLKDGVLYLLSDRPTLEALLTLKDSEGLAAQSGFQEAVNLALAQPWTFAVYRDGAGLLEKAIPGSKARFGSLEDFKDTNALAYFVCTLDVPSLDAQMLVRLRDEDSRVVHTLRSTTGLEGELLSFVAADSNAHLLDAEWALNLLTYASTKFEGNQMTTLILALLPLRESLTGEVVVTGDWFTSQPQIFLDYLDMGKPLRQLKTCEGNLKSLSTSLEMYRSEPVKDGDRRSYPATLGELMPQHLMSVPACPLAGDPAGYSKGYQVSQDRSSYSVACPGNHHQLKDPRTPRYTAAGGLLTSSFAKPLANPAQKDGAPSLAVLAGVKEVAAPHEALLQLTGLGGDDQPPPKVWNKVSYPFFPPAGHLSLLHQPPFRIVAEVGPRTNDLLNTEQGTVRKKPYIEEGLAWGGPGLVYLDYLVLEAPLSWLRQTLVDEGEQSPGARLFLACMKGHEQRLSEGSVCLAIRDGDLQLRARGGSCGFLVMAMAAAIADSVVHP